MGLRTEHRAVLFFALLSVSLLALLWLPPLASADARTDARRHFRRGMALIENGNLDGGIAQLQLAYEALPHENVLFNIARAYAEAGQYSRSLQYYQRYLDTDPADREEVEAVVVQLQARLDAERAEAEEPEPPEPPPPVPTGPAVSSEQLASIDESAAQIEQLAAATDSASLRERATRLRQLAETLRSREAARPAEPEVSPPASAEEPEPTEGSASEPGEAPVSEEDLSLGTERTEIFEERVVSASRFAESPLLAPNSTTIITKQDIRLTGHTNLVELLRRVAGVDAMSLTPENSDLSIRGLNTRQSNKVLVLIDGRTVRLDFLAAPYWASIPLEVEDIERIEVIRGPAGAVYGADAFSGIVNIITREPGEGDSSVSLSVGNHNTFRGQGTVTGRAGDLSYRLSAGYRQTDEYSLELAPDRLDLESVRENPDRALRRTYFNGELRYHFGEGWFGRAGAAMTLFDASIFGVSRLRTLDASDGLLSQSHLTLTSPIGLNFRMYWNRFRTTVDTIERPPGAFDTQGDITADVIDTELSFNRRFTRGIEQNFAVGVGYRFKAVSWNWLAGDQTENHFFAYVQDALRLHEKVRLTLSLRLDRHPLLSRVQFSPRASLVVLPTEGQSIRLTGGSAFRSPSFVESYLDFQNRTPLRGISALGRGNRQLDPERMISLEAGYTNQSSDYFALELNVYVNLINDQIQLSSVDTFTLGDFGSGAAGYDAERGVYPVGELVFDNEDARFRQIGGEVGVRIFPVNGLDIYLNYALSDTSPSDATQLDPIRASDNRTSLHKFNLGLQYRASFGLDLSADLHIVSGQTWVEQVTDTRTGVRFESFDLGAYALLNARVGYRLANDKVELGLVGTNLLVRRFRQHPFGQVVDSRVMLSSRFRF